MNQGKQLPLTIDLALSAQGEAVQTFVVAQIGEHRFNSGKALAVVVKCGLASPVRAMNSTFLFFIRFCSLVLFLEDDGRLLSPGQDFAN